MKCAYKIMLALDLQRLVRISINRSISSSEGTETSKGSDAVMQNFPFSSWASEKLVRTEKLEEGARPVHKYEREG